MTPSLLIHICLCSSRYFPPEEKSISTIILTLLIVGKNIKFTPDIDLLLYELYKI